MAERSYIGNSSGNSWVNLGPPGMGVVRTLVIANQVASPSIVSLRLTGDAGEAIILPDSVLNGYGSAKLRMPHVGVGEVNQLQCLSDLAVDWIVSAEEVMTVSHVKRTTTDDWVDLFTAVVDEGSTLYMSSMTVAVFGISPVKVSARLVKTNGTATFVPLEAVNGDNGYRLKIPYFAMENGDKIQVKSQGTADWTATQEIVEDL